MEHTIAEYIQMCQWDPAKFLIFSENVFANLVYYSHFLPLVVSILLTLIVFLKNRTSLASKWFLLTVTLLSVWLFSDLVLWANEKPSLIMFFWSLLILIEPMIYAGMLFFVYALIDGKDVSFNKKLIIFVFLLPIVIFVPTNYALTTFDLTNCEREAIEGPLAHYGYLIEIIFAFWILILGMERFVKFKNKVEKRKAILVTTGAVFFLLSFSIGNIVGSLVFDWDIAQYGLFGIPVFVAMLSYLIVKYQIFNVKLIATQLLVSTLWIMTLAILFLRKISSVRIVVAATLFLFTILGYLLIRSVKREVSLREQLQVANEGQADLLHIINHQIKGYMTKARYVFDALITDKDYSVSDNAKDMVKQGYDSVTEGVGFVQDFLNASNIEKGTFTYVMELVDIDEIVKSVSVGQKENALQRGLNFDLNIASGNYKITGDRAQLNQAIRNLLDNSIKYTPKGSVKVELSVLPSTSSGPTGQKILLTIKDTGVGISDELRSKLFTKGGRDKNSIKINTNSTGFGLALVKSVVEAHKGRVWAESAGVGKGSTFYLELPIS